MWLLRLAGYELYCGYAYVGFSSVLDGPILVHGTTDDKAVLRSTLAREQWRTEERAMEWAMLLWPSQMFKKHPGYIRVKLMTRCQHLIYPSPSRAKSRLAKARGGGEALPTWDMGSTMQGVVLLHGKTDAKVELARCYKYGIRSQKPYYRPGNPEHAECKSEPKWPGYR